MGLRLRASSPRQPRVFSQLELPSNKILYLLSGCASPWGICQRSLRVTFVCVQKITSKDPTYSVIPWSLQFRKYVGRFLGDQKKSVSHLACSSIGFLVPSETGVNWRVIVLLDPLLGEVQSCLTWQRISKGQAQESQWHVWIWELLRYKRVLRRLAYTPGRRNPSPSCPGIQARKEQHPPYRCLYWSVLLGNSNCEIRILWLCFILCVTRWPG